MNRDARVTPVLRYLLAGLALAIAVQSAPSWAVCTAANPNANVVEATPSADFTDNGNGTVTHAKTGLMWKQCAEGLSGAACTGTVTAMTWSAALAVAESSSFVGFTDWRLPNLKELNSIVETCGYTPAINETLFPATPALVFWSASTYVPNPNRAWFISFGDGYDSSASLKFGLYPARLVRGGQSFDSFDSQADFTPDDFSFTAQTGVPLSTPIPSNTITVAGINTASPISISVCTSALCQYSINAGPYTPGPGTVNNDDTVTLQQTSSASFSTLTTATLTIGGVDEAFDVTTLVATGAAPAAPRFLRARAISSSRIVLRWWDRSTNETGFRIERKTGSCTSTNPWSEIATVGTNVTTFTNTGLSASTRYSYRVRAYNAGGNSAYSNCSSART